jgi:hypothetical protein
MGIVLGVVVARGYGWMEGIFYDGQWVNIPVTSQETAHGKIYLRAQNLIPKNNAVISTIIFQTAPR